VWNKAKGTVSGNIQLAVSFMPLALVIQRARRMRHVILSSMACLVPYFSKLETARFSRTRY
jgi:hypothetical protein